MKGRKKWGARPSWRKEPTHCEIMLSLNLGGKPFSGRYYLTLLVWLLSLNTGSNAFFEALDLYIWVILATSKGY